MSLAAPKGSRRNVLQAEFLAAIGENLRALAQPVGVLAEILWVCEVIAARENPGADAPDASSLQDVGRRRKLFQPVVKRRLILAKLHRKTGSAQLEILRLKVVPETLDSLITQGSEIVRIRVQALEAVLDGEFKRLRETGMKTETSEAQNCVEPTLGSLCGRLISSEQSWSRWSSDAGHGSGGEKLSASDFVDHNRPPSRAV